MLIQLLLFFYFNLFFWNFSIIATINPAIKKKKINGINVRVIIAPPASPVPPIKPIIVATITNNVKIPIDILKYAFIYFYFFSKNFGRPSSKSTNSSAISFNFEEVVLPNAITSTLFP